MKAAGRTARLGTRGSRLATAQARLVAARLSGTGWEVDIVPIMTRGDQASSEAGSMMQARGIFVTEIERALLEGTIDLAVHSAKDMPTGESAGLVVAACLPRGDARDALVSKDGAGLADLRSGSRIGTESPRRRAFLLHARPDLEVVPIRGNVDTRLARLDQGEVEALVVAAVGLERLGLKERITEVLAPERMLPAVGQGVLAVQARAEAAIVPWLARLDDRPTRQALTAERGFLAAMGGGCRAPFAAHAVVEGAELVIDGAAIEEDGGEIVRARTRGLATDAQNLGERLARQCRLERR